MVPLYMIIKRSEKKVRLNKLTERIYFLEHEPEVDRPMLAYIKGDKLSLAIDAGYSSNHVRDFYKELASEHLKKPDFTVITHWHYDHTFGMHAISGISIAHDKTNEFLKQQQELAKDTHYIEALKNEDATTCVYVPEERVLFVGDSTSEDIFHDGYMDKEKLRSLMKMIQSTDCDYCMLSHCEALTKDSLLCYLESIL